ncbi:MAG: biopolymer transporter ExbD [Gammaproteobacteria bacterium]|nr:biopolymer transporter ExbD [Gammaproteobacteria bacterium]
MLSKFLKRRREDSSEKSVDMTPMLDIVFILLIFFIVTTSFTKEQGLAIKRPSAITDPIPCGEDCPKPMVLSISAEDVVSMDNRIIDSESISANLQAKLANDPRSVLIIKIHNDASNLALLTAVDQAKQVGLERPTVSRWQ